MFTLEKRLVERRQRGNLRQLHPPSHCIDFSSFDYLGLARSPLLAESIFQEWDQYLKPRLGSTGSRLLSGNSLYVEDLEEKIAKFHGFEAGLIFSSGYMANVGLLVAIHGKEDIIFFDAKVHASTHDGMRLSGAKAFPFRHNDLEHLEHRLRNCQGKGNRYISVESIYSIDGSKAPLIELCALAKKYGAELIVDEAHAGGVCGSKGRGLVAEYNLTADVFGAVITFGKALGTYGAIVLGSYTLKQALINFARSFIYTTALPYPILAAIKCSYNLFPTMEKERIHLQNLIHIVEKHYPRSSKTHIQPVYIEGNDAVKRGALELKNQGFDVRPLLSPTVPQGDEVLRVSLHAFNTEEEVKRLILCIESL